MAERKGYVISVRVGERVGERFDKAIELLKKHAAEVHMDKVNASVRRYVKVTVSKSGIVEDLIKQFSNDILGEEK